MSRRSFKLTVAYDGTDLLGWQVQPGGPTVQGEIELALRQMLGRPVKIIGSGRTDSGVHAIAQVASFELDDWKHSARVFIDALNTKLPDSVVVTDCTDAVAGFHAIRDARGKRYRYQIQMGGPPDPFQSRYRWRLRGKIDIAAMSAAATRVIGKKDFASFQATGAPRKTTVRTVTDCRIIQQQDAAGERHFAAIEVAADGFLYNMVRNIVGTLVEVGRGNHPHRWIDDVIAAKDRNIAGPTAPPHGLFLVDVNYF